MKEQVKGMYINTKSLIHSNLPGLHSKLTRDDDKSTPRMAKLRMKQLLALVQDCLGFPSI